MNTATIREKLHDYIEHADEKHLAAMYVLLEKEMDIDEGYDAGALELFNQRRQSLLDGKSRTFSPEETFQFVRTNKPQ